MSAAKLSQKFILEFRQQLKNLDEDEEGISSDKRKIDQLITINTILKDSLTNISVEITTQLTLKRNINDALNLNLKDVESPETVVNEVENAIYDIKKQKIKLLIKILESIIQC